MDLKGDHTFEKLVTMVRQLPDAKKVRLKAMLSTKSKSDKKKKSGSALTSLLLSGPVMHEAQFELFKANRAKFEGWQKK